MKIQVCELLKTLLDNEQVDKKVEYSEMFYKEIMTVFVEFLSQDNNLDLSTFIDDEFSKAQEFNRSLEYSRSLVL